jgi:hypothetical protein
MTHYGTFYGTVLAIIGAVVATIFIFASVSTAGVLG